MHRGAASSTAWSIACRIPQKENTAANWDGNMNNEQQHNIQLEEHPTDRPNKPILPQAFTVPDRFTHAINARSVYSYKQHLAPSIAVRDRVCLWPHYETLRSQEKQTV